MKKTLAKIIGGYNAFAASDLYIVLAALVVFVGWTSGYWAVSLCVLAALCALPLFTSDCNKSLLIFFLQFTFAISHEHHDLRGYWWLLLLLIPLIGGVVFQSIRFGRGYDWKLMSPKRIKGQHFWLLAMALPFALGGIGRASDRPAVIAIAFCLFLLIGLVYSYYMVSNYRREDKQELPTFVLKNLLAVGMVISFELIVFYIRLGSVETILNCLQYKLHSLGWGGPNNIGLVFTMTIPATFYFCTRKTKLLPLYVLLAIFQLAMLLSTGSRGAIFVVLFALLGVILYVMAVTPYKKAYGISLCVVILGALALLLWKADKIIPAFADRFALGFSANGRFEVEYPQALEAFKAHPLFGAGWDYMMNVRFTDGYTPMWFHSTALQVMAMMGVFGLAIYAVWLVQRYRVFYLMRRDRRAMFLFVSSLLFGSYCMVDTGFFSPSFLVMALIVGFSVEVNLPEGQGHALPRRWVDRPQEPADLAE